MSLPIRLADRDWLSAPSDAQANVRWEGLLDPAGITTSAQIGLWCWGDSAMQAATAQINLLDADGALDAASLDDLSGEAVAIHQADSSGTFSAATAVARYVVDRLTVDGDGGKTLSLRDAHGELDKIINSNVFEATVSGLAGQLQPMSIGAVFNAPVLLTGSDGSVGWLADAPQAVAILRDRADVMEPGTWSLDTFQQQVLMTSPPIGPMTANISSVGVSEGQPAPATLQQFLREVMRRAGITAWSSADAAAIDSAGGYAGIGMYANAQITARTALALACSSFGCWYWQDGDGVLRLSRIVAPESLTSVAEINWRDLLGDLTYTTDTAPALTVRMAYQLNASVMRESDFVTDLVDVPHELRAQLSSQQGGIVTAAGGATLPEEYRHAIDAEPYRSLFYKQSDAQAEINRIVEMYQVVRHNWLVSLRATDIAPKPGQCVTLTYPRYGLDAGKKLLVRRVERNPVTGDTNLTLWG